MDDVYSQIIGPKRKAGFSDVAEILYSPVKTFRKVMDSGHAWAYPFIIFWIILAISFISKAPYMESQSSELALLNLTQENVSAAITVISIIFSLIAAPIIVVIAFYFIPSLIFMFFESFVMGGNSRLRQIMNVTAYAAVPMSIGILLSSAISFVLRIPAFSFSPVMILPESMRITFLGMWLGIFDLFAIWVIILIIIGLAALYGHRPAKTAAWLIPVYLATYTLFAFVASLASNLSFNPPIY